MRILENTSFIPSHDQGLHCATNVLMVAGKIYIFFAFWFFLQKKNIKIGVFRRYFFKIKSLAVSPFLENAEVSNEKREYVFLAFVKIFPESIAVSSLLPMFSNSVSNSLFS